VRDRLSTLLVEYGIRDHNVMVLTGDHGYALFDDFRKNCGTQFVNAGVSEQAMVGYAAGLAKDGYRPIVYGLAAFIPMRVLEFIKIDVCYENLPVIFLGDGAGLVYSTLGPTHQCGEDIAALRSLPNLKIYSPSDAFDLEASFRKAMSSPYASYIRIGKSDQPKVHSSVPSTEHRPFVLHTKSASKVAFISTGAMVNTACRVAKTIGADVWSSFELSEIDSNNYRTCFGDYREIVTLEEHCAEGGLGSIVAESIAAGTSGQRLIRIGLKKQFTSVASTYEAALREHDLTVEQILAKLERELGSTAE